MKTLKDIAKIGLVSLAAIMPIYSCAKNPDMITIPAKGDLDRTYEKGGLDMTYEIVYPSKGYLLGRSPQIPSREQIYKSLMDYFGQEDIVPIGRSGTSKDLNYFPKAKIKEQRQGRSGQSIPNLCVGDVRLRYVHKK